MLPALVVLLAPAIVGLVIFALAERRPPSVAPFSTRPRRIGFLLFCAGWLLMAFPVGVYMSSNYYRFASFLRHEPFAVTVFWVAAAVIFLGYLMAWHYEPTIGKLLSWIKYGNSPPPPSDGDTLG